MNWVQEQLDDEEVFPSKIGAFLFVLPGLSEDALGSSLTCLTGEIQAYPSQRTSEIPSRISFVDCSACTHTYIITTLRNCAL